MSDFLTSTRDAVSHRIFSSQPRYRLELGGQDLSPTFNGRLISLSLNRKRGDELDTLELVISDHDGRVELPSRGVTLKLALGWASDDLIDRGTFVVDEVEFSGAPDKVTIRARSANMRDEMPVRRNASWHQHTLGQIVRTIARRYKLTPRMAPALSEIKIEHIDQNEESDLNFLNRLGQHYGGTVMINADVLIMLRPGESKSASGLSLYGLEIHRHDGDQYAYRAVDRDTYTGVKAHWQNASKGRQEAVSVGTATRELTLKALYASEEEARHAAQARLNRIRQHAAEFSMSLARAYPELTVESPIRLTGFKREIDGLGWVVTEVSESLSDSGYTMSIQCITDGIAEKDSEHKASSQT